jgi:predicted metal-dependent TIM-barrel fold hydrolase
MALTKETVVDQITVTENGIVLVRETTTIKEDGVELSKQYHRSSFIPESDISSQPANVQAICSAAWTPEVIAAYKAQQAANALANTPTEEPTQE